MAATIDTISALAHPSWREAAVRAARERVARIPDTTLRTRQVGYTVLAWPVRETGAAAYQRQNQQYTRWKEAAASRPTRITAPPTMDRFPRTGALLDLKL